MSAVHSALDREEEVLERAALEGLIRSAAMATASTRG